MALSTFGGRRACWSSEMRLGRMTSTYSLTWTYTKSTTSWLVHCWSTFGVRTHHGQIRTHKTHQGSDLREATTFPLIVYFVPLHEADIQIANVGSFATFGPHNFVCRLSIEMKIEKTL
jgi:hypothetical protein